MFLRAYFARPEGRAPRTKDPGLTQNRAKAAALKRGATFTPFDRSGISTSHESRITSHESRITSHESRVTRIRRSDVVDAGARMLQTFAHSKGFI